MLWIHLLPPSFCNQPGIVFLPMKTNVAHLREGQISGYTLFTLNPASSKVCCHFSRVFAP